MSRIDETRPFIAIGIAVLTVSDTRGLEDDKSGDTLVGRIEGAGHKLAGRAIVKDDIEQIRAQIKAWSDDETVDADALFLHMHIHSFTQSHTSS